MRARFSLHPLLALLVSTALLSPAAGCGGSSVDENQRDGAGGSSGVAVGTCDNPIATDGSGWISCDGRFSHRETAGSCGPFVPRTGVGGCNDADCASMLYGHCSYPPGGGFGTPATCIPGCLSDGDCDGGEICFCEEPVGRCIPADCTADTDCEPNAFCTTYVGPETPACSFDTVGATCQKTSDACVGNECNCALVNGERACVQGLGGCSAR